MAHLLSLKADDPLRLTEHAPRMPRVLHERRREGLLVVERGVRHVAEVERVAVDEVVAPIHLAELALRLERDGEVGTEHSGQPLEKVRLLHDVVGPLRREDPRLPVILLIAAVAALAAVALVVPVLDAEHADASVPLVVEDPLRPHVLLAPEEHHSLPSLGPILVEPGPPGLVGAEEGAEGHDNLRWVRGDSDLRLQRRGELGLHRHELATHLLEEDVRVGLETSGVELGLAPLPEHGEIVDTQHAVGGRRVEEGGVLQCAEGGVLGVRELVGGAVGGGGEGGHLFHNYVRMRKIEG